LLSKQQKVHQRPAGGNGGDLGRFFLGIDDNVPAVAVAEASTEPCFAGAVAVAVARTALLGAAIALVVADFVADKSWRARLGAGATMLLLVPFLFVLEALEAAAVPSPALAAAAAPVLKV
jgi:hypothetical protein